MAHWLQGTGSGHLNGGDNEGSRLDALISTIVVALDQVLEYSGAGALGALESCASAVRDQCRQQEVRLDLRSLRPLTASAVEAIAKIAEGRRVVGASSAERTEAGCARLLRAAHVESFHQAWETDWADLGVVASGGSRITWLDLSAARCDGHLSELLPLAPSVRCLDLSESFVEGDVAIFSMFPELVALYLAEAGSVVGDLKTLLSGTSLTAVNLRGTGVEGSLSDALRDCRTDLKLLDLSDTLVEGDLDAQRLTNVVLLSLMRCGDITGTISTLAPLRTLVDARA